MPQLKSAAKALRASERRRVINDRWRRRLREHLHEVRDALTAKDQTAALATYRTAQSTLDRAARHHLIHPNKAARQTARLKHAIDQLGQARA